MAEVFAYRDDRWSDTLRHFGAALGRFLYIMDACMDLDSDSIRNRYNPFRRYYGLQDNGKRFMVPAVDQFILSVDVENMKMVIRVIPGMLDS